MIDLAMRTTRFQRLLRRVQRPWIRYVERKALGRHVAFANRLLERLTREGQVEICSTAPCVTKAVRTRSDVVVMLIGDVASGDVSKVLKLPLTARAEQSTAYHRQVVMTLHQTPGLEAFCALIPRSLTWGEYEGQTYYLETAVPGVAANDLVRKRCEPESLLQDAVQTILLLHLRTAQLHVVDDAAFARLAGDDLTRLRQLAARWPEAELLSRRLETLESLLRRTMYGRELPFSWTHGDYWPGNILTRADGSLSGIVDWDRASANQLPILDILHLLAYTRKMRHRAELGEEILTHLLPAAFDTRERALVDEAIERLDLPTSAEFLQAAALLYWLHFAAANLSRYPSFQTDDYWMSRNIYLVLKRGLS